MPTQSTPESISAAVAEMPGNDPSNVHFRGGPLKGVPPSRKRPPAEMAGNVPAPAEMKSSPGPTPELLRELHAARAELKALEDRVEALRRRVLDAMGDRDGRTQVPGFGVVIMEFRERFQFDGTRFRGTHPDLWRRFARAVPFTLLKLKPDAEGGVL